MILPISSLNFQKYNSINKINKNNLSETKNETHRSGKEQSGVNFYPALINSITFKGLRKTIPDIGHEEYKAMSPGRKEFLRKKCKSFSLDADASQMFDPKDLKIPLLSDKDMADFVKISSVYNQYRDHDIICLGRSPKWFLNTSLWMKDGIKDYKFVPFSQNWLRYDPIDGMVPITRCLPTEAEEEAYFKFLKHKQVDPATLVENYKKTGKKTIITDYIQTSKGLASFLDILSKFAVKQNVPLKDFAQSIQIIGIGSLIYTEGFYYDDEDFSEPTPRMPERLMPYEDIILKDYKFYDMTYPVFEQMLLNRNSNECRSTFFPHRLWGAFNPDKYKTGMMSEEKMRALQLVYPANKSDFTPAMKDYRNLLNFRILDYLETHDLLTEQHKSKI